MGNRQPAIRRNVPTPVVKPVVQHVEDSIEESIEEERLIYADEFKQRQLEIRQKKIKEYNDIINDDFKTNIEEEFENKLRRLIAYSPPYEIKFNDTFIYDYIDPLTDEKLKRTVFEEMFAKTKWKLLDLRMEKSAAPTHSDSSESSDEEDKPKYVWIAKIEY